MQIATEKLARGFTLIEAVVVIAITGILAAVVAIFIRAPVEGYVDSARRASLTDIADTATRRISRDLHAALPNSLRLHANNCIEYLPTITGGRYRADPPGDALDFSAVDSSFDVLGAMSPSPAVGDQVVVYNLGVPGADAYSGDNRAAITAVGGSSLTIASMLFPLDSPSHRFQVVPNAEQAVAYICTNAGTDAAGNGTGSLFRRSNYGINATAPTCASVPAGTPLLADRVSACSFSYAADVTARNGLVSMRLSITENNETVSLYQEVHVNNAP